MTLFDLLAIILVVTAAFFYINQRFLKFPMTVGVMALGLGISLIFILMQGLQIDTYYGWSIANASKQMVRNMDFSKAVVDGMLSFMLFAGALHLSLGELNKHKWVISCLATLGVILSTIIFGFLFYLGLNMLCGIPIPLIYCFLLGAVVSPTDPIAVLAMLKRSKAPKDLQAKIAGESLFNDGVGIVVVLLILGVISHDTPTLSFAALIEKTLISFVWEVFGAIVYGLLLGGILYKLVLDIDDYKVEVFMSLALVYGGYTLAHYIGVSGPISIVVMGIFAGNFVRHKVMTRESTKELDSFWIMIDEFLNAILFTLIGFEVLSLDFSKTHLLAGGVAILVSLMARYISVWIPIKFFTMFQSFSSKWIVEVLTWGGLRGGLSVALALSLPPSDLRLLLVFCTYSIVFFSIIIQALTMESLVLKRLKL